MRLDLKLVELGLARSRKHATDLIDADRVLVDSKVARKASLSVGDEIKIEVLDAIDYVSRAGHKLAKALEAFGEIEVQGKLALDVGASTGGFTDVLLRKGARQVIALDVGHDQLLPELRENSRVVVLEGFNAREMSGETLAVAAGGIDPKTIELVVADLSFISLTLVLEALVNTAPSADFVLLIKPQFEVGKQSLSASGIVNDWSLRAFAIKQVLNCAFDLGVGVKGLVRSGLPGTHGNIEYVLWISPSATINRSQWLASADSIAKEPK
jgi:23S rRNA (cytidine1920-2'-O)/16S rRNA (cytidine1409-2'-O)-methyltransferase